MGTTNQKIQSHSIKQQQDKNNSVISKKLLPPLLLPKTIQAVIKEIQIVDIASNLKHKVSPFWKNIETALAESTLITSLSSRKNHYILFYHPGWCPLSFVWTAEFTRADNPRFDQKIYNYIQGIMYLLKLTL